MKTYSDKIIQPYMTEKSTRQQEKRNEYAVIVDQKLTKTEIKEAITKVFGIAPLSVRTVVFRKKAKRTKAGIIEPKSFKKALVRLPDGKRLELK